MNIYFTLCCKISESLIRQQHILIHPCLTTEFKNTLEGTNSGITDAEDRISEVEERMVEINEAGRKKGKNN